MRRRTGSGPPQAGVQSHCRVGTGALPQESGRSPWPDAAGREHVPAASVAVGDRAGPAVAAGRRPARPRRRARSGPPRRSGGGRRTPRPGPVGTGRCGRGRAPGRAATPAPGRAPRRRGRRRPARGLSRAHVCAVGQHHGGGGEAVTAGVRALPHLPRPRCGRLEGDGPAADGAADVAPGVGAHQQGRFARARERRQGRQRRPRVPGRERVEGQPSSSAAVGDVAGEQPRRAGEAAGHQDPARGRGGGRRRAGRAGGSAAAGHRPSWQAVARAAPSVGVEVRLGQGVAAPRPALLDRQPEPRLGRACRTR